MASEVDGHHHETPDLLHSGPIPQARTRREWLSRHAMAAGLALSRAPRLSDPADIVLALTEEIHE